MKVQIIFNKVKNKSLANLGIISYKQALEKIGYTVQLSFKDIDKTFQTYQFSSDVVGNATSIQEKDLIPFMEDGNRITICILGSDSSVPRQSNPVQYPINKNGNTLIVIPEHWYGNDFESLSLFLLHETAHAGFFFSGKKDTVHTVPDKYGSIVDGNRVYYLDLLKELKNDLEQTMATYKYFKPSEIIGLKPELVQKLDEARGLAGVPFPIGSGLRTPDKNAAVGGVENSAHLTGEAVDIKCDTSEKRWKMLNALIQVGFNRIGINKTSIHCDISKTLPQNMIWTYYK